VGGKEETLRELAGLMLEECPRLLEQMRRSLADGDVEELRRAAHTLKGSARLLDSSITSATRSWHSPDSRSDLHGAAGS
jgi:HPt (histidine-containing phosphotransfer) domain-containing protein|tara:strand:- start:22 stop:258 length:237 start_codon:yes stop_codon:yes gene_type:complete